MLCNFELRGVDKTNQYEELIKVFLQPEEYRLLTDCDDSEAGHGINKKNSAAPLEEADAGTESPAMRFSFTFTGDKDLLKRQIFEALSEYTGKHPKWGILTGIRPVKLAGELLKETGSIHEVKQILTERYLLHPEKTDLICEILEYQHASIGLPKENSLSLYIGIPFCPTRCLYCSFPSNQKPQSEVERYLQTLLTEVDSAAEGIQRDGYILESIYIGGGTPTTLDEPQLERLLGRVNEKMPMDTVKEFTVEAGRPDTITGGKLDIMKRYGVTRISINPQSMKQETLELIGRAHTVEDVRRAFHMADRQEMDLVNADLIAGLPGESFEDFQASLQEILELGAKNITLHTLAVKRASRLKDLDEGFHYKNEVLREQMLEYALNTLRAQGYRPYYLYRQKHTSGSTENIGFCKDDTPSIYNIRIMEEAQSILALGAGAISKIYFPKENRLERVPNVTNYEIYIERIDEMIERKNRGFWR